jgi:hypothetical protein
MILQIKFSCDSDTIQCATNVMIIFAVFHNRGKRISLWNIVSKIYFGFQIFSSYQNFKKNEIIAKLNVSTGTLLYFIKMIAFIEAENHSYSII